MEQPLLCGTRRQLSQYGCYVDSNSMHHCEDGKVLIAKDQSVTILQETSMLLLYLLVYCPKPLFILSPKQQQIGKDSLSYPPKKTLPKKFSKFHEMPSIYQNMVSKNIGILFHDQVVWVNITGPAITARLNLPRKLFFSLIFFSQKEGKGWSCTKRFTLVVFFWILST